MADAESAEAGASSRAQVKRAARLVARQACWARKKELRKERRDVERERRLARAREAAPAAETARPTGDARESPGAPAGEACAVRLSRRENYARLVDAHAEGRGATLPSIAIDLSHDALMRPAERTSMAQQLMFSYACNKRCEAPLPLHFTSFGGETARALDKVKGAGWLVHRHEQPYWEVFPHSSIVVLSAEATDVLLELEPGKVYVIGGLVDHNRHKGLIHGEAHARGLACARLPLEQFSTMVSRKVLAVNHVLHLLLRFRVTRSWPQAIVDAVPGRKGLRLKPVCGGGSESGGGNDGGGRGGECASPAGAAGGGAHAPSSCEEREGETGCASPPSAAADGDSGPSA
ncbi:hypothetical protein KFE25_012571 [Diacronema lutheri]|uniref:tRNA (guanine(9)-N(1))-methyltransferase n=1 Tax=Diacronema lutheri TaxID=2081491 RepID=A0A8J5XIP2_DIALT|nr:hypothetical protein KFE25_012571 [Diacronema lutheri]